MPEHEGTALFEAASSIPPGPIVEIGSYCGRSTVLLAAAAERTGSHVFTIDHHLGSEEHQPGEGFFDPDLFDPRIGRPNTLPHLLETLQRAGVRHLVTAVVGSSAALARMWTRPIALVFIDGGHSAEAADADYEGWAPHLMDGGLLAIHDVFPDPADGGRPPFEIYERALSDGFSEASATGSLRILRRV